MEKKMKVEDSPSFSQGYQLAHEVPFTQDAYGFVALVYVFVAYL